MEDVFKTLEADMSYDTYDFDLCVANYYKKGILQDQPRNIRFGCLTDDQRHIWISIIEFLKTKTVYDQYVNRFIHV